MSKETNTTESQVAVFQTGKDLMSAVFIVSVLLNMAVFIAWLLVSVDPNLSLYLINSQSA
jgi:hypothetical protein